MDLRRLLPADPEFDACRAALTAAGLPTEDLADRVVSLFALQDRGEPVAFGGLERHGDDVLLRSVVTPQRDRGRGLGKAVVDAVIAVATDEGARTAWLLTTDAGAFFSRLGFAAVPRDSAPAAIAATRQFSALCPGSATLMRRTLRP